MSIRTPIVSKETRGEGMELGANQFADPELGTERQDTEGDRQTPLPPSIDATVRAPLDYAHTAIAVMAALSRSEAVDADALPVDLQRKARARGDDLDNIVSEQLTTRHRRTSLGPRSPAPAASLSRSSSAAPRRRRASPLC